MGTTYTSRLGLAKPDGNEFQIVSVLNSDWDLVDKAVGARVVGANQVPAAVDMYDGLLVNERNTGKTWMASWNGTTYDKAWIRYPFFIYSTSGVIGSWGNGEARSLTQTWQSGVNSSATNVPGGSLSCPITGIYSLAIYSQWGTVQTLAGTINVTYQVNGVNAPFTAMHRPSTTLFNTVTVFPPMVYAAGTKLIPRMYQYTGDTCNNAYCHTVLQLITPTGINNT